MTPAYHRWRLGFTLVELTVSCVILFLVFLFLFPVFSRQGRHISRQSSGASNQKQIALAFLQYIQDNDERFPPVVGYTDLSNKKDGQSLHKGTIFAVSWGPDQTLPDGRIVPGLINPYIKSNALFIDPDQPIQRDRPDHLYYMYNDLLAMTPAKDVAAPERTVLTTDAEDRLANAGHAFTAEGQPFPASFTRDGRCVAGQGASVGQARFRHSDGANFSFADGHVKWSKGGPDDPIFFPPRESSSGDSKDAKTKQQVGPTPSENMVFGGRHYTGTFHVR